VRSEGAEQDRQRQEPESNMNHIGTIVPT
jgi:hypothetical protein